MPSWNELLEQLEAQPDDHKADWLKSQQVEALAAIAAHRGDRNVLTDTKLAHLWAPILQSIGPALLQEAQDALEYGERMVSQWLEARMFHGRKDAKAQAKKTAAFFNDKRTHKSHGRRIDREEAKAHGVVVEDLEDDQELQELVLSAYHLFTIIFEKTPCTKILASHHERFWMKNFVPG